MVAAAAKPRILCLHGRSQSAAVFSNKIAGARRKLSKLYDLDFLDAPVALDGDEEQRAWWNKDPVSGVQDREQIGLAVEYVLNHMRSQPRQYSAILGFSQGGLLATALAATHTLSGVQAVVTAGAPMYDAVFEVASAKSPSGPPSPGLPKFHLAGETDSMVPVESVQRLCERGGNGTLVTHEQGHLFPTRAGRVNEIIEFLAKWVPTPESG